MPSRAWVPLTAPRYVLVAPVDTDRTSLKLRVLDAVGEAGAEDAEPHPTSRKPRASSAGPSRNERRSKANSTLIGHPLACARPSVRLPARQPQDSARTTIFWEKYRRRPPRAAFARLPILAPPAEEGSHEPSCGHGDWLSHLDTDG